MSSFLHQLLDSQVHHASHLLELLNTIQDEYRHIPESAVDALSNALGVPRSQIMAVAQFYRFLHLTPQGRYQIFISDSITDQMLGNRALFRRFSESFAIKAGETSVDGLLSLDYTSCTGLCDQGPAALINGLALSHLDEDRVDAIVSAIRQRLPLADWPAQWFEVRDNVRKPGLLLSEPWQNGAALQACAERGNDATLAEIEHSLLRGRGGAGFKTGLKWRLAKEAPGATRYVVCNADEGEPGTFKDRVLLNSHADAVFEGMSLCARIIGASRGFVYLRGEYRYLRAKLEQILQQRRADGLLGDGFDIEIRLGAGAYICGEESALIESLEGKPGIPRNRPPYPVTSGYLNQPTAVDNVETFMAAAYIARHGAAWFNSHGTAQSTGSKILSISGDCARPGIYEYDFGTSMQQIVEDCGATDILGLQVGGPSGSFIAPDELQRQLAFEDLATGGSLMVFNRSRSLLDIAHNFTHFFAEESCGFCTPCRVGTSLLKQQLDKITGGHGSAGDVAELQAIAELVKNNSHCGLGQTAANPVLTTLARFPDTYQSRLKTISFEPGFDLDGSLATARRLSHRNDAAAHLAQVEDEHE
jgi:[NiFe] hydrogenase diaphorase moiety large subunit